MYGHVIFILLSFGVGGKCLVVTFFSSSSCTAIELPSPQPPLLSLPPPTAVVTASLPLPTAVATSLPLLQLLLLVMVASGDDGSD